MKKLIFASLVLILTQVQILGMKKAIGISAIAGSGYYRNRYYENRIKPMIIREADVSSYDSA